MTNVANQAGYACLQAELDTQLNCRLQESGDEFLPARAYIKKWNYKVDATGTAPYRP
jgi:hypothetical protein